MKMNDIAIYNYEPEFSPYHEKGAYGSFKLFYFDFATMKCWLVATKELGFLTMEEAYTVLSAPREASWELAIKNSEQVEVDDSVHDQIMTLIYGSNTNI